MKIIPSQETLNNLYASLSGYPIYVFSILIILMLYSVMLFTPQFLDDEIYRISFLSFLVLAVIIIAFKAMNSPDNETGKKNTKEVIQEKSNKYLVAHGKSQTSYKK